MQTKKTTVRQVIDISEEVDRMAAQLSEIDTRLNEPDPSELLLPDPLFESSLHDVAVLGEDFAVRVKQPALFHLSIQDRLLELFWQSKYSIDSNSADPFAERHLRFCLWRLRPNPAIVNAILPYLVERPWLGESIYRYLQQCKLSSEATQRLGEIIDTHNVYDNIVALAIETLMRQGVSLRSRHELFRRWLADGKRDWPLLSAAAMALGESTDNMTVLTKAIRSTDNPSVHRMALIQALRLARNEGEAVYVFNLGISDNVPSLIDTLLYLLYNEWGLTLSALKLSDAEHPTDYCIACAKGYDDTLPDVQPAYMRHTLTKFYGVKFASEVDFHDLLGSEYERAADFLWQAQNSYLVNPSRYVSQLDLFHEELLFPILVDRLRWKSDRAELAKVAFPDRMESLRKTKNELAVFADTLLECHRLRSSCTEAHTRLEKVMDRTSPVNSRQRDSLKKSLCAGYQQLADWLSAGCL